MSCLKYLDNTFYLFILKGVPFIFYLFPINLKILYLAISTFIQYIYVPIITNKTKWVNDIKNK